MAELLEAFGGGVDDATAAFLVEALSHAEPAEWEPILDPWVAVPGPALDLLVSCPGILERAAAALAGRAAQQPASHGADVEEEDGQAAGDASAGWPPAVLREQLLAAGFSELGLDLLVLPAQGVTVELAAGGGFASATVDGAPGRAVEAAVRKALKSGSPKALVEALLQVAAGRDSGGGSGAASGAGDSSGEDIEGGEVEGSGDGFDPSLIPAPSDLGAAPDRQLSILTWGFFKLDKPPPAQVLINCSYKKFHYLTRNNKHIIRLNGLDDVVQGRICRNTFFSCWLRDTVSRIEREDLQSVSFCCAKGTHLSVAIAEIMRKAYYPKAIVRHLTLAANRPGHTGGPRRL